MIVHFRSRDRLDRLALYKNARRIFAIVSTISIPISAPMIMEASVDPQPWGPYWMPIGGPDRTPIDSLNLKDSIWLQSTRSPQVTRNELGAASATPASSGPKLLEAPNPCALHQASATTRPHPEPALRHSSKP
jgi:hypothetical protein